MMMKKNHQVSRESEFFFFLIQMIQLYLLLKFCVIWDEVIVYICENEHSALSSSGQRISSRSIQEMKERLAQAAQVSKPK